MGNKAYNKQRRRTSFQWVCNICRRDDEEIHDKADVTILKESEKPEDASSIKSSNRELTIIHLNCRSILNKLEELLLIIEECLPDIIVLTETWMDDSVPSQACIPEGYSIIRKDRSPEFKQKYGRNKGGGVAILYRNHIKVEKKKYLTDDIEEILWVHVKVKHSFMLGALYRSEYTEILYDGDGETKLEENIRKASEISNNLIITGDYNIDMADSGNPQTKQLTNIYEEYGLQQHIHKPTRINKSTNKATIIDHIWASKENNLIKTAGTFHGISDHLGIYMKLNKTAPAPEKEIVKFRDYRKYDPIAFNNALQQNLETSTIDEDLSRGNVNAATESLVEIIQVTAQIHAPLVEINTQNRKKHIPWFTAHLKDLIKYKNELISDLHCHGLSSYKPRIAAISNKITQLKRSLKMKFVSDKLEEANGDSKKCWKLLDSITARKKAKITTEPSMMTQEKANSHNRFFATIGIEIQKKLGFHQEETTILNDVLEQGTFKFQEEKESKIEKLIDNIKIDVAVGDDNIGARLLKDIKTTITPVLTKIINRGYQLNIFPDCMKRAVIKPIHKKDSEDEISNYRPISILPTLSKVFERSAVDQLVYYLEQHNLISPNQHAYRKKYSTITCLTEVVNYIYSLLDKSRRTAIASLDLSKAFDSICHTRLLKKLRKLGLQENPVMWINSYLTGRKQVTKFKKFTSDETIISSGIPQGSILGPLLFLCFTNDLAKEFEGKCKIVSYADDTQLIIDAKNINQLKTKIEEVITIAQNWYCKNSMQNNIGKTEVLLINTGNTNETIKINIHHEGKQITIKSKENIKVLGIFLDTKLNWTKQVQAVKRKAMDTTRNIHRINHILPEKQRLTLYKAVISPLFGYADIIWNGCGERDSQSLQRVQNFAVKSITGNRKYDSASASL